MGRQWKGVEWGPCSSIKKGLQERIFWKKLWAASANLGEHLASRKLGNSEEILVSLTVRSEVLRFACLSKGEKFIIIVITVHSIYIHCNFYFQFFCQYSCLLGLRVYISPGTYHITMKSTRILNKKWNILNA